MFRGDREYFLRTPLSSYIINLEPKESELIRNSSEPVPEKPTLFDAETDLNHQILRAINKAQELGLPATKIRAAVALQVSAKVPYRRK